MLPDYWHRLFAAHGYTALDSIRRKIRNDRSIDFWYRQNIVLYASERSIAESEYLAAERVLSGDCELEWVHASVMNRVVQRYGSVRSLWKELRLAASASLRRRFRGLRNH